MSPLAALRALHSELAVRGQGALEPLQPILHEASDLEQTSADSLHVDFECLAGFLAQGRKKLLVKEPDEEVQNFGRLALHCAGVGRLPDQTVVLEGVAVLGKLLQGPGFPCADLNASDLLQADRLLGAAVEQCALHKFVVTRAGRVFEDERPMLLLQPGLEENLGAGGQVQNRVLQIPGAD
ncbi:hypothetical protein PEM37_39435 [Streptomyces sp. AD681]|uniref:hypothetical protein n=1 Tax=Streptomyces sp. AD681 TaxID=3019069 RepID=UPI0022F1567B|nr:hypothetical protein [Streptomyces sp. AD681]MDA5147572.1 hypothetical protein [Streptomyces sp. AD681]